MTTVVTTTDSITIKLYPHKNDSTTIEGYKLQYKLEFGDWETIEMRKDARKHTIGNLLCGSRYQIRAMAYNR